MAKSDRSVCLVNGRKILLGKNSIKVVSNFATRALFSLLIYRRQQYGKEKPKDNYTVKIATTRTTITAHNHVRRGRRKISKMEGGGREREKREQEGDEDDDDQEEEKGEGGRSKNRNQTKGCVCWLLNVPATC